MLDHSCQDVALYSMFERKGQCKASYLLRAEKTVASSGNSVCLRKAMMMACCSPDRTVDLGTVGQPGDQQWSHAYFT